MARSRAVAMLAALLCVAAPASAREDDANVHGSSNSSGVDVIITAEDEAASHVPGGGSASECEWSAIPYYDANYPAPDSAGPQPSPEHELYLVFCNGDFVGIYWLGPQNFPGPDVEGMAGEVVDHVPVDLATIAVRPDGGGVTGIASYFWVEGYRGEAIDQNVSGFGVSVDVSITLGSVVWDFGDGTPTVTAGLGEPWPDRSSVNHTYEVRGLHTVTVTITLLAEFRVDGGAAQPLPPIVRTASLPYQVDEIQAVRDR